MIKRDRIRLRNLISDMNDFILTAYPDNYLAKMIKDGMILYRDELVKRIINQFTIKGDDFSSINFTKSCQFLVKKGEVKKNG